MEQPDDIIKEEMQWWESRRAYFNMLGLVVYLLAILLLYAVGEFNFRYFRLSWLIFHLGFYLLAINTFYLLGFIIATTHIYYRHHTIAESFRKGIFVLLGLLNALYFYLL